MRDETIERGSIRRRRVVAYAFLLALGMGFSGLLAPPQASAAPVPTVPTDLRLIRYSYLDGRDDISLSWRSGGRPGAAYVLRGQAGTTPPTAAEGIGFELQPGGRLSPASAVSGPAFAFSLWAADAAGTLVGPATLVVRAPVLQGVRFSKRVYGKNPVTITGRLVDGESGAPVAGAAIDARTSEPGHGPTGTVSTRTGADGSFRLRLQSYGKPFQLLADSGGNTLPARATLAPPLLRPYVYGGLSSPVLARGGALKAYATTSPARAGLLVKLQERVGTKWKTVSKARTGRKGTARFNLRVRTAGTHRYRMTFPKSPGYSSAVTGTYGVRVR